MQDILIDLTNDKGPYIKEITTDKIINLTGQSGSGKSTYARKKYNTNQFIIVDTDDIFNEKRFKSAQGINKELGKLFRKKYKELPNCSNDFDLIYKEIIDYCHNLNKTVVIDCAQLHSIKNLNILKGQIVIFRTSVNTCYERCIERFKKQNPNYTNEELDIYKEHKKKIFTWYKYTNEFILKIERL